MSADFVSSDTPGQRPRITLIGRVGCHLCDDARKAVQAVASDTGVGWVEQDVDSDPELAEAYGDRVPVLLLDGSEHAYWRVDEDRLRAALAGHRRW